MPLPRATIERNLHRIQDRIRQACDRAGRNPDDARLIAVTKSVGLEEIRDLHALGVTHFGENRTETSGPKIEAGLQPVHWHMIGSVQRRKAGAVAALFDTVDSVDRIEVAEALERRCAELNKTLQVLVEVNVSGEESKHGFAPDALENAVAALRRMKHLKLDGLMTMAPLAMDAEQARPVFSRLRELAKEHGLTELSMGMSNDFEVAIEEGATQVRIGSALFEEGRTKS